MWTKIKEENYDDGWMMDYEIYVTDSKTMTI